MESWKLSGRSRNGLLAIQACFTIFLRQRAVCFAESFAASCALRQAVRGPNSSRSISCNQSGHSNCTVQESLLKSSNNRFIYAFHYTLGRGWLWQLFCAHQQLQAVAMPAALLAAQHSTSYLQHFSSHLYRISSFWTNLGPVYQQAQRQVSDTDNSSSSSTPAFHRRSPGPTRQHEHKRTAKAEAATVAAGRTCSKG